MTEEILSRDNARVRHACRLRDSAAARREEGLFFAEGLRLCTDLAQSLAPLELFYTRELLAQQPALASLAGRHALVGDSVAQKLSDTRAPQGVFGIFARAPRPLASLRAGERYLCLEHVQDPANVGTLLRSAAAFGFAGAVLCAGCADPYAPKAVRASMGALARIGIFFADETKEALCALKACGACCIAAALQGSLALPDVDAPSPAGTALWIGNEGGGLAEETVAAADIVVRIPMAAGVESLNAAAAGSVLLWHFRKGGGR